MSISRVMRARHYLTSVLFSAAVASLLASSLADAQEMAAAPGRLLHVGRHRLHIDCRGQGTPTVVIEGGAGTWSIFYGHVQRDLVNITRVCTYDRAGLGWSDSGPAPRTSARMAEELHQLLHAAGEAPPLLLVGHSLGAYNVRIYQRRYPEEVGGLVLVDGAHEAQWNRLPPEWAAGLSGSVAWLRGRAKTAADGGLKRADVEPGGFTEHSVIWRDAHIAALLTPKPYLGEALETESAIESATQVSSGTLGALPLVVLTARRSFDAFARSGLSTEPANRVWLELQVELAQLSSNSVQLFSERDHAVHVSDPASFVTAVQRGIDMVRAEPRGTATLGLPPRLLPTTSTPAVDGLLTKIERAYERMNAEEFVSLFTDDMSQLDVSRRVHVRGRESWLAWTREIIAAHARMERRHRGRAVSGDWVIAEVEWSGTVRGEAAGLRVRELSYRYSGIVLMRSRDGKIAEQVIYGDVPSLIDQLSAARPPSPRVEPPNAGPRGKGAP